MISVCMATYNGEPYIKEQLDSILSQIGKNDEVIISDDGSTDNTLKIVEEFNDSRIKIYHQNSHCYTKNFENALAKAKGEYIFLSDQDDIWHPDKVKITLNYLKQYNFVVSNARIIDENGKVIHESRNDYLPVKDGYLDNLIKTYFLGCCMAFDRNVLKAVLPFPLNRDLCFHDSWIAMVSELCFKTHVCEECLIDYRRHGNNASAGSVGVTSSISRMIRIRLYLFFESHKRKGELRARRKRNKQ